MRVIKGPVWYYVSGYDLGRGLWHGPSLKEVRLESGHTYNISLSLPLSIYILNKIHAIASHPTALASQGGHLGWHPSWKATAAAPVHGVGGELVPLQLLEKEIMIDNIKTS